MKSLLLLVSFVAFYSFSNAQETATQFKEAEFNEQFAKLTCSGKNDFAELIDKQVVVNGDTSWKSKLKLPGLKFANFSKSKSMIDYAFVAYQKFPSKDEANGYYQLVKQAINASSGDCIKLEPARIPMGVKGVEQYDLWKSTKNVAYNNRSNTFLYVSLNLDSENEVVVNVFLR